MVNTTRKLTPKQMQRKRGEWLEAFLNPKIQVKDYPSGTGDRRGLMSLASDALKILEIKQEFDLNNDPVLNALDAILQAPRKIKNYYLNSSGGQGKIDPSNAAQIMQQVGPYPLDVVGSILKNSDPLKLRTIIFPPDHLSFFDNDLFPTLKMRNLDGLTYRNLKEKENEATDLIHSIFNILYHQKRWAYIFQNITKYNKDPWSIALNKSVFADDVEPYKRWHEKVKTGFNEKEVSFSRYFDVQNYIYQHVFSCYWSTVVVTIALEFIMNDGQKRFIFCEQCGRFTFVRRNDTKHSKRYCSPICRVTANNKRRN